MLRQWSRLGLLGSVAMLALGCTHARLVEKHGDGGGVVAIPADSNPASSRHRKRAEDLMSKQCPNGYVIDHEQEVIVGTVSHTNTQSDTRGSSLLAAVHIAPVREDVRQTTSYEDKKEWRIWFRPKDAPPSPGIEPAGGKAPPGAVIRAGGPPQ